MNWKNWTYSGKKVKSFTKDKSFKDGYAKAGGKNGFQKISLSDSANVYITEKGEAWYVSEQPDGSTAKVQLQPD